MKNHKKEFLRMIGLGELENHTLQNITIGRIITGYCNMLGIGLNDSKSVVYSILNSAGMLPPTRREKIEEALNIRAEAHLLLRKVVNTAARIFDDEGRTKLFFIYYYIFAAIDGIDAVKLIEKTLSGLRNGEEHSLLRVLRIHPAWVLAAADDWMSEEHTIERITEAWSKLRRQRQNYGPQN